MIDNDGIIHVIDFGYTGSSFDNGICKIGQIRGKTTASVTGINVLIDVNGQLGTTSSTRDTKKDIKLMDETSSLIKQLKSISFKYKCVCYAECKDGCKDDCVQPCVD